MYAYGWGVQKDDAMGTELLGKAAAGGDAIAQFQFGWMLANGIGVPKDQAKSVAWWQKSADQGHAAAQFGMGTLYEFQLPMPTRVGVGRIEDWVLEE